jgi:hypothetical protein
MKKSIADLSPRKAVTILRLLYPIWFVVGLFGVMYVPSTLIVPGDATTTANNIMANELLFSMGIAGSLITQLIQIVVVLVLYKLFKSVNKNQASLMVVFALVGVPITMLNTLNRVAALLLSSGAGYLTAFEPAQLHSLVMFFLNLNEQGVVIAEIFWGLWLFPLGILINESGYFPRILGFLMVLAGFGYFLGTFTHYLLPKLEALSSVLELMVWGELPFMGWVLLKGAKLPKMKSLK